MLAITHELIGVSLALGVMHITNTSEIGPPLIGAFLGSLLPDIDHSGSRIGRIIRPFSWLIRLFFGHRKLTHSLLAIIFWLLIGVAAIFFF